MMANSQCRRYRFGLKTLLVLLTMASLAVWWLVYERNEVRRRERAIRAIVERGGIISYDEAQPFRPGWLRPLLGLNSPGEVVKVSFFWTNVTDPDMVQFDGLTKLQWVVLDHTSISDAGLKHLAGPTGLVGLSLAGNQVTDAGFPSLAGLTNLEWLDVDGTQVTDAGLARLKGLTRLEWLDLESTQVTDAGLVHLVGLTQLQYVLLKDTEVTDQGLDEL